jgi:hypothetical protein
MGIPSYIGMWMGESRVSSCRMKPHPYGGERMDRTLSVLLAVLAVFSVILIMVFSLTVYMGITYRSTLASTYDYRVSIGAEATLGNATLYLPVPGRLAGNSAVLEEIGQAGLTGIPAGWNITLIGTEKVTLVEVTAREIPPAPSGNPYRLSIMTRVKDPIGTGSAGFGDLVLAPIAGRSPVACTGIPESAVSEEIRCEAYRGSAYADFTGPGDARLTLSFSLTGKNAWDVFGPSSNEYRDGFQVSFSADEQGWRTGEGLLVTGIGDYGMDFWVGWTGKARAPAGGSGRQIRVTPVAGGQAA